MEANFKPHFSFFSKHKTQKLHFAAHSHHPWPDAVVEMHQRYTLDSARLTDEKWSMFYSEVLPKAQQFVAELIGDTQPDQVVFAGNTHEFILRLLSCLPTGRKLRVLSSDHEFYSFKRQMLRLEEDGLIEWKRIGIESPQSFYAEFEQIAFDWQPDMVFCSHVTFDRGLYLRDLPKCMSRIRSKLPQNSLVVIDGYHSLGAVDVSPAAGFLDEIFYLGGSYKYLAAGEGACFMRVPVGCDLRPRNTGWFADFSSLETGMESPVGYAESAQRFAGATMDFSAIYRLVGASELWSRLGFIDKGFEQVFSHVSGLQSYFLEKLQEQGLYKKGFLTGCQHVSPGRSERGSFLCFSPVDLKVVLPRLRQLGVVVDGRESTLRVGFGVYHCKEDVDALLASLAS